MLACILKLIFSLKITKLPNFCYASIINAKTVFEKGRL